MLEHVTLTHYAILIFTQVFKMLAQVLIKNSFNYIIANTLASDSMNVFSDENLMNKLSHFWEFEG